MELTEREKRLIRMIGNKKYTIDLIEMYWKKNAKEFKTKSGWTYNVMIIREVNAFMEAIEGIEKILEGREHENNNSA